MIDEACPWCGEPVLGVDDRASIIDGMTGRRRWQHRECALRSVSGSVAHINQECSCYLGSEGHGDPPGMTRRQAARAAWFAWLRANPEP